mmetsp:Transcript_68886/g.136280  ORF Transcript_68886/g.136280 Transcript_68886/m.136280 type:complete len:203 (-) Transcript_68886:1190-1798(-)
MLCPGGNAESACCTETGPRGGSAALSALFSELLLGLTAGATTGSISTATSGAAAIALEAASAADAALGCTGSDTTSGCQLPCCTAATGAGRASVAGLMGCFDIVLTPTAGCCAGIEGAATAAAPVAAMLDGVCMGSAGSHDVGGAAVSSCTCAAPDAKVVEAGDGVVRFSPSSSAAVVRTPTGAMATLAATAVADAAMATAP